MRIKVSEQELLEVGYRKVYTRPGDAQEQVAMPGESRLRNLKKGQRVKPRQIRTRHRGMSEADLVRLMQQGGLGRPATYAGVVDSLLRRKYIMQLSGGGLQVSERGRQVLRYLTSEYPNLFSLQFTAEMEEWLDDVLRTGDRGYKKVVGRLWDTIQS